MEHKMTTVLVPKNRYRQIQRALLNSNDPVLALGADFSTVADSHLVAVQTDEDHPPKHSASASDYETQAINIHNKTRKGKNIYLEAYIRALCLNLSNDTYM
jgi:MAD (mothers against decapentaplegic) interacting protein